MENKEKQVRKIAQRVMTKYKLHPPVDMMGLIQEKGITCVEENLGTNADGYSDLKDSDLKIVLNSAIQYEPRKRFTLAHELGHIFISWHSDVTLCVTDNEYSEHNKLDIQEHEANVFASEILMPTEWVKEMLTLNENRSLEYNIKQLCTIANTSIMACFYALENAMKSGNVIVVSGDMFFPKKFISDRRMTLYFQGYDEYDVWDDLCLCKEEFDIGNYQVCHYVFPECPSMEQIETAFSTTENVVSALELIFGNDFSAWCCWMGVVLNQISHIYNAYLFAKNECVKHYKNEKSLMQLYYSDKLDLMNECKLFEYDFYEVNFGNDWTMVLIKEPCYVIDKKVSYSDSRLLIKEILSEMYTDDKRIKFGKKMNAEKGRVPNIVFGYDKTIGDYFKLSINENEAKAIRQIFQWYIEEGYGGSKIANMLNERGIKTKRGNNWSQNAVCRILTNEIYTGKIINGKEEIADFLTGQRKEKDESEWLVTIRPELRIIEEEVFDKAQDILKGRHDSFKITHERQSNKYLFSTLIKCKECGWSFRRTVRQYKNTYVRWVCSGHNGKGADSCPNAVTVDEEELIQALQEYFQEILSKKKKVINYVIKEFQRVYKAKDENIEYEKQLNAELNKLHKSREKYMDMYTDDLISREELNEKIGGMRKEIERLENELKMVSYHLTKGEQLEAILNSTFKQLEDITDVHEMTNAQLKRLINKIEVDKDGNVDIYLHLIGDLGLDETVLIEGDKNTEEKGTKKVPNSYNHT